MSTTTTTTTTDSEQQIETAFTLSGEAPPGGSQPDSTVSNSYLSPQEPASNPSWWPTNHRQLPDYRPPQYHPEWRELTGNNAVMDAFVLVLFGGCHIISVK